MAGPGYLRRLLRTAFAYQVSDLVSKPLAIVLLPVYTRHLTEADYGLAELVGAGVVFFSIVVRLGIGEAFVRYHYEEKDTAGRNELARRSVLSLLAVSTTVCGLIYLFAGPIAELTLDMRDPTIVKIGALGLWAFSNLELAQALLRVEEKALQYAICSITNVLITVSLTVWLVVFRGDGANGLLFGNYAASSIVLVGLWIWERDRLRPQGGTASGIGTLLRFGLPTVPADASVFALNLIDRAWLFHGKGAAQAGLYSLSVKLSGGMIALARGFQYAWPPLAYSVKDDKEAAKLYASVTTWYATVTGMAVAGLVLMGRWVVRLLAAPDFYPAWKALPWVALGWAMYGMVTLMVTVGGRAKITTRNFPAAIAGLVANIVLLALLVPSMGISGAGIALVGAYVVMLAVLRVLTRNMFEVGFEWLRLAHFTLMAGGISIAGNVLLPTSGAAGLVERLTVFALIPLALWATRFVRPDEARAFKNGIAALKSRRTKSQ